jgi:glycine/D-amino acid oxidase-like deaminating enzyme
MSQKFDIAIVGAGMAGASLGAHLLARGAGSVVMLEGEDRPDTIPPDAAPPFGRKPMAGRRFSH